MDQVCYLMLGLLYLNVVLHLSSDYCRVCIISVVFNVSCYKPSFIAPVVIVYDEIYPCNDDGCTSDADSEVGKLQAAVDNGVWVISMPCQMYELKRKQGVIVSKMYSQGDPWHHIITLQSVGSMEHTKQLQNFDASLPLTDNKGVTQPRVVVQYFFQGAEKVPVYLKSHGNSKCKERPY